MARTTPSTTTPGRAGNPSARTKMDPSSPRKSPAGSSVRYWDPTLDRNEHALTQADDCGVVDHDALRTGTDAASRESRCGQGRVAGAVQWQGSQGLDTQDRQARGRPEFRRHVPRRGGVAEG